MYEDNVAVETMAAVYTGAPGTDAFGPEMPYKPGSRWQRGQLASGEDHVGDSTATSEDALAFREKPFFEMANETVEEDTS
nr:unnamed protein product [Spirometra erinaceieuropaei]